MSTKIEKEKAISPKQRIIIKSRLIYGVGITTKIKLFDKMLPEKPN